MASGALRHSNSSSTTPFHHRLLLHHPWHSTFSLRFPPASPRLPPLYAKHPRGAPDPGAERFRSGRNIDGEGGGREKKQKRRWWSDDGAGKPEETAPGLWEEFVDNMWFFKVLQPYGWMLPFIILSWLLASGPKAFLMASSVPFGLSVLTFAVKKLFGLTQSSSECKPKSRKRSRPTSMRNRMNEEDDFDVQRKSKRGTRSSKPQEGGSVNSSGATGFGGWDDLIDEGELETRQAQRSAEGEETRTPLETRMKELGSNVEERRDLPLLLRLLVAVFPFLSSWTELP